jgi:uncharacterized SAM-binding protein YcdF (DUF218 family)
MKPSEEKITEKAHDLFRFLYLKDELKRVDAIIGFGHFDLKIPHTCGSLYTQGFAPNIIFTGGIGAGSADLNKPEASVFKEELQNHFPPIPEENIFVENKSTNTGENIEFTTEKLQKEWPETNFSSGINSLIIVANAARQRRVWLTWRKQFPNMPVLNYPPETTFDEEFKLFKSKGRDLIKLMIGEMQRIIDYPYEAYTILDNIPKHVYKSYRYLKEKYYGNEL